MGFRFESKNSDEEQGKCVQQCLEGKSKDELAKIYNISHRTIDRWINKICSKEQKEELKRRVVIPAEKEEEIMKILSCNAILYGFNISIWNSGTVQKLLKNNYNIEIMRYTAKKLIKYSKKIYNEIEEIAELEDLNYKIVLLDFIKIGEIKRIELEDTYYERFNEDTLNVNIGIARAANRAYISIIYSDIDIVTYGLMGLPKSNETKAEKEKINLIQDNKIKLIQNDKISFIKKVIEKEGNINNVVFVSRRDIFMERFKKSNEKPLFYILNNKFEEELIQDIYELGEENSLLKNIKCSDENYIEFASNKKIFEFIEDKIQIYNETAEKVSILKYL